MTIFSIPLKRDFFNLAVSSLSSDLPFKPYFLFFNRRFASVFLFSEPSESLDCIPSDYILGLAIGYGADFNSSKNIKYKKTLVKGLGGFLFDVKKPHGLYLSFSHSKYN